LCHRNTEFGRNDRGVSSTEVTRRTPQICGKRDRTRREWQGGSTKVIMTDSTRKPSVIPVSTSFEELLDTTSAAALLKVHPKTLQRLARKGKICGVQIGKLWRFRVSALNEWLNSKSPAA
jgi:excisionase family DNA binding protein